MAPESFPRGKAPQPASTSTAYKKQSVNPSSRKPPPTYGGGPAAKRKREAKTAGSSSSGTRSSNSTTTPSSTSEVSTTESTKADEGPDFLFGLPKKKLKQSASSGGGGSLATGGKGDGLVDEASKIARAVGLGCVTKVGRAPPQIQPLSLKRFSRGTAVLGIVTRVGPKDIGVALPGGISGRVSFPEVSDPMFAHFSTPAAETFTDSLQHQETTLRMAMAALRPGQMVRAVVLSMPAAADKHKGASFSGGKASQKLSLTLRASVVNRGLKLEHLLPGGSLSGAVASVEDHGYVIATGLEGITAFLARRHVKGGAGAEAQLIKGSPVDVVVLAVKEEARSITCGFDPTVTPKALTRGSALTLQGLKPGMLVNAAVDMLLKNGLVLTFLGGFSGVVILEHLDRPYVDNDWRKRFRLGDVLQARVMLVNAQSKTVYLTLRTHLLGLRPASGLPEVSQLLAQTKVLRVEPKKGLLLGYIPAAEGGSGKDLDTCDDEARIGAELASWRKQRARAKDDGEDDGIKKKGEDPEEMKLQKILEGPRYVPVFVQASQVDALASVRVGQTVACRVIGTAPMEGAVYGSMKAATLEAPFVCLADVTPGQLVHAKVMAVAGWGLTLDLGQGIRAHCTNMHLADGAGPKTTSLRAKALAEAKKGKGGRGVYQAGQQVSCRILQVDLATRKVYATLKPSLLKDSPETVIAAYSKAAPGRTCLGFVTKVGDFGVIVTFYGNVHGLLPAKHLAAQGVESPVEAFRLGQVLRCVVASCEPHREPPRLSLRLDVPDEARGEDEAGKQAPAEQLRPGQRVSGTVERIQDPYAMVRLDRCGSKEPLAFLHKYQLGDHAALADQLLARLAKGSRVEDALVLELRRDREGPLLSLKPLLRNASGGGILDHGTEKTATPAADEPVKLQDLKVGGARLCGYISRVESFGLFIRFVGGQIALAPRGLIADRFVEDASGLFREGDSVRSLLHRVDPDMGKVYVTTQRSQLPVTDTAFLETLLCESVAAACGNSSSRDSNGSIEATDESDTLDWRRYAVGSTVNAIVTAIKDYGVVLSGEDHRTVMLAPGPEHVLACAPHDEVKVRILDVDWAKRVLVVTLLPELVKRGRAKHRKSAAGIYLPVGARGEAEVVLKRDRYAVVELEGALAYLAVADYQCPYLATGNLEVGIKVDVVVRRPWRLALETKPSLVYPQEPVMLVTLAQEQDVAERDKAPKAGASKKLQKEFKKLQQQKEKEKKAEAAVQQRISIKESKAAAAADKAEKKSGTAEHVARKRPRATAASEVVVGATLPAIVVEVRPDELVLALNIQHDEDEEKQRMDKKRKGKKSASARVLAKVFVTHSGRQHLIDLEEAAKEALEARQIIKEKGEREGASLPSFHPLAPYKLGQELDVRVVEVREKELSKVKLLECSLRPKDMQASAVDSVALQPAWETLAVGTILLGVVTDVQAEGLWVAVSRAIKGFVHYLDIARDGETGLFARITAAGAVGVPVPVVVTHVDPTRHRLQLSIRGVPLTDDLEPANFPLLPSAESKLVKRHKGEAIVGASFLPNVGDLLTGRVCLGPHAPILNPPSVAIQLGHRVFGRLCITEINEPEHWVDQPLSRHACALEEGQDVRCRVLVVEEGRIDVSLRPSRLQPHVATKAIIAEDDLPEEGAVVKGYVVGTSTKGCFVRVARGVTARVQIKDLADGFVKSPIEAFPVGKLVAGRVLKVEEEGGRGKAAGSGPRVDLSLRPSVVVGKHLQQLAFEDVEEGMKIKGAVVRVEPFGVFIKIQGSDLTGMSHISEASDQRIKDLAKAYEPGDVVKALVLKADRERKRISLSLKASHFKGEEDWSDEEEGRDSGFSMEEEESECGEEESDSEDMEHEDGEVDDDEPENFKVPLVYSSSDDEHFKDDDENDEEEGGMMEVDGEDSSKDEENEEEKDAKKIKGKSTSKAPSSTSISTASGPIFHWDDFDLGLGVSVAGEHTASASEENESDDDHDDEDEGGNSRHRSSRKKAAQRKRDEEEIRRREERLLDPDATPESIEDFERLVMANPNSSLIWIRYMAFHLSLADIDAARAVATRALKTIVFREEFEKMNVWVALLNLENRYGTKESVLATLEKAAEQNNPKHVYLHAAEMYERAGKASDAEELFKNILTKRFKYSKKMWMQYHLLALKRDPTSATELLRRSLQCLSRHKHTLVISHFAQAEFEHGSIDRGRTIFEGLLSSFPKRLDIWNMYVDKEVKTGHVDSARRLLDRMCTLGISAHKAKGILKKYMQLELAHGDAASVERVRDRAKAFVESNMSG
ncbi:rrp5 homolog [Nannochloropsis oceanica]